MNLTTQQTKTTSWRTVVAATTCLWLASLLPSTTYAMEGTTSRSEDNVGIECLATNSEHTHFRCLGKPSNLNLVYECLDENEECRKWANQGECSKNPQFMKLRCRQSCKTCLPLHSGLPQTAYKNPSKILERLYQTQNFLHKEVERDVRTLDKCVNKDQDCTHWWSLGECDKNPRFMHHECGPACQTCHVVLN